MLVEFVLTVMGKVLERELNLAKRLTFFSVWAEFGKTVIGRIDLSCGAS